LEVLFRQVQANTVETLGYISNLLSHHLSLLKEYEKHCSIVHLAFYSPKYRLLKVSEIYKSISPRDSMNHSLHPVLVVLMNNAHDITKVYRLNRHVRIYYLLPILSVYFKQFVSEFSHVLLGALEGVLVLDKTVVTVFHIFYSFSLLVDEGVVVAHLLVNSVEEVLVGSRFELADGISA
jgi:hypothetical protein